MKDWVNIVEEEAKRMQEPVYWEEGCEIPSSGLDTLTQSRCGLLHMIKPGNISEAQSMAKELLKIDGSLGGEITLLWRCVCC